MIFNGLPFAQLCTTDRQVVVGRLLAAIYMGGGNPEVDSLVVNKGRMYLPFEKDEVKYNLHFSIGTRSLIEVDQIDEVNVACASTFDALVTAITEL
jgi:hypothetical protein